MTIDEQLISRLEKLARLRLADGERTKLAADLTRILEMVEKLDSLQTADIQPLVYLNESDVGLRNDAIGQQASREEIFRNAAKHDGQFFRVPKIID